MSKSGKIEKNGLTYSFSIAKDDSSIVITMSQGEIIYIVGFSYPDMSLKSKVSYIIGEEDHGTLYHNIFDADIDTFKEVAVEAAGTTDHLEQ